MKRRVRRLSAPVAATLLVAVALVACGDPILCNTGGGTIVIGGCADGDESAASLDSGDVAERTLRFSVAAPEGTMLTRRVLSGPVTWITQVAVGVRALDAVVGTPCAQQTLVQPVSGLNAWVLAAPQPQAVVPAATAQELCAVDVQWAAALGGLPTLALDGILADGRDLRVRSDLAGGVRVLPAAPLPITESGLDAALVVDAMRWLDVLEGLALASDLDGSVRIDTISNVAALVAIEQRFALRLQQTQPAAASGQGEGQ